MTKFSKYTTIYSISESLISYKYKNLDEEKFLDI